MAPAKLNLGLRIVGRRPDGYHLLSSLFVPLTLADELTVSLAPGSGVDLRVSTPGGNPDEIPRGGDNLVVRAARAYLGAVGRDARLQIFLEKRIPVAAGLGGGSSDAGCLLVELAEQLPGISGDRLAEIALGLGADVPYFLDPKPAWVGGIGEVIEAAEGIPSLFAVLVHPGSALPTGPVFKAFAASPESRFTLTREIRDSRLSAGGALRELEGGGSSPALARSLGNLLTNDLEVAASHLCPEISRLRQKLVEAGARVIGLSGSGPTLYALFGDRDESREFEARLIPRLSGGERCWRSRTLPSESCDREPGKTG